MTTKRVLNTVEEVKLAIEEFGQKGFFKRFIYSEELEKKVQDYKYLEKEGAPAFYNYHFRKPGPHIHAEEFHNSKAGIKSALGGNRSGKTYTGAQEFACHLTHIYPPWWQGRVFTDPVRLRYCAPTYERHIVPIFIKLMKELLPPGHIIKWDKNSSGFYVGFHCKDGSYVQMLNYNHPVIDFSADQFHVIWEDEPPTQAIHAENCLRVLDYNGYVMITATVIREQAWLYDELQKDEENKEVFITYFKTIDNPTMTEEKVQKMEKMLFSDEERLARLEGKPAIFAGQAFKKFDEMIHVVPTFSTLPGEYTHYMGIDPHPREDWHMAWYAINNKDQVFVIEEEHKNLKTFRDVVLRIALVEGRINAEEHDRAFDLDEKRLKELLWPRFNRPSQKINPFIRIMDTSGWEPEQDTGQPKAKKLALYGVYTKQADKSHPKAVTTLLDWINPNPAPMLFIQAHCREHIREIKNCFWDDYVSDHARERHDALPKFRAKNIHFIDLLKYLANANPQYMMVLPEQIKQKRYIPINEYAGI